MSLSEISPTLIRKHRGLTVTDNRTAQIQAKPRISSPNYNETTDSVVTSNAIDSNLSNTTTFNSSQMTRVLHKEIQLQ